MLSFQSLFCLAVFSYCIDGGAIPKMVVSRFFLPGLVGKISALSCFTEKKLKSNEKSSRDFRLFNG